MRPKMKDLLMNTAGRARTENNAVTNATTDSAVLNLFALGGALRNRDVDEVTDLIDAAWREDRDLALRVIFFLGDVRGGQGERDFLFNALRYLARKDPGIAKRIIALVPEYSRWDMLFAFINTALESNSLSIMHKQFRLDLESKRPSLLAKWLPSPGTKSQTKLASKVAWAFGLKVDEYRKLRAKLNKKIDTVEIKMSDNRWDAINYESVPGKAFMIYQKAFERHGYEKMQKFVEKVQKGEAKMKSDILYPHEIMRKALWAHDNEEVLLEKSWESLPNFIKDGRQGIAVIDTSASMTSCDSKGVEPMLVAKSLGLYLSEKLSGPYKDHYITFSEEPIMAKFHGETLKRKYNNMKEIVASTNIEAVYELILNTAINHNLPQEELPTHIYIFSDMEFNSATSCTGYYGARIRLHPPTLTLFETIKQKYHARGYEMPATIFWNLDARNNQHPVQQHETGTALVSGFSPANFKYLMEGVILTPYETMLNTLNSPRYAILSGVFKSTYLEDYNKG